MDGGERRIKKEHVPVMRRSSPSDLNSPGRGSERFGARLIENGKAYHMIMGDYRLGCERNREDGERELMRELGYPKHAQVDDKGGNMGQEFWGGEGVGGSELS